MKRIQVALGVAFLSVAAASLAACGGSPSANSESEATAQSLPSWTPEPTYVAPTPDQRFADTGIWSYDAGYNESFSMGVTGWRECDAFLQAWIDPIRQDPSPEDAYYAFFQGCMDATQGRDAEYIGPFEFPITPFPYTVEDPCMDGDIGPWVIIYDGPGGSGDISVGAPCQEVAEQYALEQLPPGSFIIESWRA